MKIKYLLAVLICIMLPAKAPGDIFSFRKDLETLKEIPCQDPSSYDFWKVGVFDSQIRVGLYKSRGQILEKAIHELAKKQMETEQHRGFYTGKCSNSHFYIVTTPSPVDPYSSKLVDNLRSECISYQVSRSLEAGLSEIVSLPIKRLKSGSSSIVCRLRNSEQEWFLFPPLEISQKSSTQNLPDWLNHQRSIHKLSELHEHSSLNLIAKRLIANSGPLHDRLSIKMHYADLVKVPDFDQSKFLLEDRVAGKTLGEIQDLLWWSPKHRDLLLNSKAKRVGIAENRAENRLAFSIVITD